MSEYRAPPGKATQNPNAHGQLRGLVEDSAGATDPSQYQPIVGATVVLNLKTIVPATAPGDTASMTVIEVGQVVTDANGRFLVTSIPEGEYFIMATPPDSTHYMGTTWAFASSGSSTSDATIYLPRITRGTTDDSLPPAPPPPPVVPPIDSM
ncbi:MAG: hypothetical protein JJD97_16195 [Gemmatimonadaceae bacterium]|nr:hypothetical protein [Gemmatimonadaceae bacterium]